MSGTIDTAWRLEPKDGEIVRLAPAVLQEALAGSIVRRGDSTLDEMLEPVPHKILNRSIDVRRESLEKLWDAWERLKTLEPGRNPAAQGEMTAETLRFSKPFGYHKRRQSEAQKPRVPGYNSAANAAPTG